MNKLQRLFDAELCPYSTDGHSNTLSSSGVKKTITSLLLLFFLGCITPILATCTMSSGGKIGNPQSNCGTYSPSAITNVSGPSSPFGGPYTYKWQKTTDPNTAAGNASNYYTITGANGSTYDPGTISVTSWYRRCAARTECGDFPSSGYSNWVKMTVDQAPDMVCEGWIDGAYSVLSNCEISICQGRHLRLSVNPNVSTVNWTGPNGYVANGTNDITLGNATPAMSGQYTATLTQNGCTATKTITVHVNATPNAGISGNLGVCNGKTTTLNANGDGSATWSNGSTAYSINVGAGTYSVTFSNYGCTATATATVTNLGSTVGGTVSPAEGSACGTGPSVPTPSLSVSGIVGTVARWEYLPPGGGWTNWGGAGSNTSPSGWFSSVGQWRFRAIISGPCGEAASSEAVWHVNALPGAAISGNLSVCNGQTTTLTANGNGSATWSNGSTAYSINVGAGTYSVTFSNYGCTSTATATVTNLGSTVGGTVSPAEGSVCSGPNVPTPSFSVSGIVGTVARWEYLAPGGGWTNWGGAGSNTSPGGWFSSVGQWKFRAIISGPCGEAASSEAVWHVNALPGAAISGNLSVCNGQTTTLTANGNGSATWSNGSTAYSINVGAGTYSVTFSNYGCTSTATATVTSGSATANISGNLNVCTGQTTTLTASGGGTYSWSNGSTNSSINVGAGTYTVTVTNGSCTATKTVTVTSGSATANISGNLSVCSGQTTTLTASGGGTYSWSNGSTNPSINVGAGTYTVTVTSGSCTATKTVTITTTATTITIINCPQNISLTAASNNCAVATWTAPTATSNCGTPSVSSNYNPGYCFPVGTTTVTYTAILNGVSQKCSFNVIVNQPALGSIGDFVFCDNNNNRVYDAGDTPISGVTVTLCNANNVVLSTTATNTSGNYSFGSLAAGTYIVKFPATLADGKNVTTTNPITVNLTAGQNYTNADAGYYKAPLLLGSIGDFVFCDNNNNRVYDAGDTPISGVTVTLCNANNVVISTTVTNTSGNYSFGSLAAGTYIVKFPATLADGKTVTTTNPITVTLTAGQNYVNADAGYYKAPPATGSIGDFTFNDNNNNGIYDTGDTPKSNILVTLCNSAGQTISTTLSVSGNYSFGNLPAATYIVKFPAVHTDGKSLTTPQQITVNLAAGQNYTSADAGYNFSTSPMGSIGDLVFCDNNNNRIYDAGDTPISGVTVTLCNASNVLLSITTTNTSGNYSFGSLVAGSYIVKFPATLADGKTITTQNPITVNLTAGQNYGNADAGYYKAPPATGSIGDFAFNDNNNNGIYDTGDTPKSNILVTLCNSAGQTISTTLTVNGLYSFGNLPAGTYIVKFPAVHTDGKSLTTPQQITVNLAAGQNFVNADAGYYKPTVSVCSIGDFVFCDNNNNRIYDSGDTPISGVTVTLCNSSNVVLATTTTNASGNYSFTNLAAGTYIVKFPATLADGKAITTTNPITVNLTTGQNFVNADAGYYKPTTGGTSSIKDVFVFCDNNKNQIYDAGDSPIQGVTVTLCNASNQVITTAVTDASGSYSFLNLAAGTYIVKFPATLADGKAITTTNPITITLGTGETSSAADAGYYKSTTVDCSATRDNSIVKTCSNNVPVLTGTALAGYEYQWLSSTSICPNNTSQAIAGATGQNYTLPSNVSQTTYFMRCARPIGCTSWDAVTESNCLTVNASDCTPSGTKCDAVVVKGNTNGTISVTGLGSYTSFVQVFNNLWQSVSNQEYNQASVSIPIKNGTYSVNVLLYDANSGGWIFLCEKTVSVTVTGGVAALSKNTILDINAFAEAQRAQIQWVNNTGSQNDFFTVEKLNNVSGNFEKIETVNSKPTDGNEAYSIYDNAITEGDNTYRVQLTMLDGQVKTSALKTLTYKNLNDVRIYPNPASDFIEVDLKQYEGKKVTLYIYNQVGKIIQSQQIERASATPIHIDMDKQTNGQMLLRVTAEGHREVTKKFVIQN